MPLERISYEAETLTWKQLTRPLWNLSCFGKAVSGGEKQTCPRRAPVESGLQNQTQHPAQRFSWLEPPGPGPSSLLRCWLPSFHSRAETTADEEEGEEGGWGGTARRFWAPAAVLSYLPLNTPRSISRWFRLRSIYTLLENYTRWTRSDTPPLSSHCCYSCRMAQVNTSNSKQALLKPLLKEMTAFSCSCNNNIYGLNS